MKKRIKKILIYITCTLWIIDVSFLFSFVRYDYDQIDKVKVFVIYMILGIISLLMTILTSKITVEKGDASDTENNGFNNRFGKKITGNIWSRINSMFHKILKIGDSYKISPQVRQTYEAANNHSFHGGNLPQGKAGVN